MERPNVIFTPSFDFCRDNFFKGKSNEVMGELMSFIRQPTELPEPALCGVMKIRTKELLPLTNTIAFFWDYGRVWEFYGIIENGNIDQLKSLENLMDSLEKQNQDNSG